MLDIRIPIGLMFTIFGVILVGFGIVSKYGVLGTDPTIYQMHSLGRNINFYWGIFMLVFGGIMLLLARWRRER
jgi:hypothetical protein